MLVKDAMSEKNRVTSLSSTPGLASTPAWSSICTTGQGTYLPQDLIAFFMLSKIRWIWRISAVPRSKPGCSVVRPASCSCTMLCISSARARKGFRRPLERCARSLVSIMMPSTMMKITRTVVRIDSNASLRTASCTSNTATVSVSCSRSSFVGSDSVRSGNRSGTRSVQRYSDCRSCLSISLSELRGAQMRSSPASSGVQRCLEAVSSLQ
mmetsp:Transcript_93014/g.259157  ORF Transcript_93014/g.259157 Transcript_93014/m.259157 type:complete len:210 (+) Transcript_93014:844-1473(+)